MSSGLTSPTAGNRTDDIYFGGGRVVDQAITNRLVAEPGTRWRYANNDTMTVMRVLHERAISDDHSGAKHFDRAPRFRRWWWVRSRQVFGEYFGGAGRLSGLRQSHFRSRFAIELFGDPYTGFDQRIEVDACLIA